MWRPSTLFSKLFLGTSLLIVGVLGLCAWLIVVQVNRFYAHELTSDLKTQASLLRQATQDHFDQAHAEQLQQFVQAAAAQQEAVRITLIRQDGTVLADSEADLRDMVSHADRPEFQQALAEGWGQYTRYSETVSRDLKYVALRVGPREVPVGVVRVSMATRTIGQHRGAIRNLVWTITSLALVAALLFALGLARIWSHPIRRIAATAQSLSKGNLSARARVVGRDEMATLGRSLNQMRDHLEEQLSTIDGQKRTLESLLTQLQEGVVVADAEGKVRLINPAAVTMLGLPIANGQTLESLTGKPVEQYIWHHELQGMLVIARSSDPATGESDSAINETRIQVGSPRGELHLLARCMDIVLPDVRSGRSPRNQRHKALGRMLVLTDITEFSKTVRIKMDFASNASHELRTPLSTIRAAVETLQNMDPASDPEAARHFIEVVDRQSSRMERMVSDLLNLSRIESSPSRFKPQPIQVRHLMEELYGRHVDGLKAKQLHWEIRTDPDLRTFDANGYLLNLVLDNLVDNAIKFTDTGGHLTLTCEETATDLLKERFIRITVADDGCGIADTDQSRVFERFYQVQRARSGPNRGTGLGLSIVRHAAAAMNGTVELTSEPGQSTRVTMTIPQSEQTHLQPENQ